jgi:tetratricopeptide (TPR) repeat protein
LFQRCWGGVYVGDDSLNRAIGSVRKLAGDIGGGSFQIETIPRTGYRLTVTSGARPVNAAGNGAPVGSNRRLFIGGGAAAVAAFAGVGLWWANRAQSDARFDALVRSSEQAVRKQTNDDRTIGDLQQAVVIRPDSARAWGLLAFLKSLDTASADPKRAEPALKEADGAARNALAIDPREPYALLAMFELQGSTLDWAARDRRLRQIIAIDPDHLPAIGELVLLTQAAGLNRESWNWNERAIALDPFSLDYLSKRALKLWIAGRVPQADKVIDQVRALYPTNPWPKWVRFLIYAMTDRPRAALAILEANLAAVGDDNTVALWRTSLVALDQRSAETVARARSACIKAAQSAGSFAVETVMILSALGEVDAAFEIANGFLLSRGSIVAQDKGRPKDDINDATWRINTQYLFTPPCRIMRADRRFLPLCDGMGLTDYWRERRVKPDFLVSG